MCITVQNTTKELNGPPIGVLCGWELGGKDGKLRGGAQRAARLNGLQLFTNKAIKRYGSSGRAKSRSGLCIPTLLQSTISQTN